MRKDPIVVDVGPPRLTPDGRIGVVNVTYREDFEELEPEPFMIVVFTAFALTPERVIKELGLGLAMGRAARRADHPLPARAGAEMQVVGARAWWAPSWLARRMPHLAIERE